MRKLIYFAKVWQCFLLVTSSKMQVKSASPKVILAIEDKKTAEMLEARPPSPPQPEPEPKPEPEPVKVEAPVATNPPDLLVIIAIFFFVNLMIFGFYFVEAFPILFPLYLNQLEF